MYNYDDDTSYITGSDSSEYMNDWSFNSDEVEDEYQYIFDEN